MRYNVLTPDGVPIEHAGSYETKELAEIALDKWVKSYEKLGYYSSYKWEISVARLKARCKIVVDSKWNVKLRSKLEDDYIRETGRFAFLDPARIDIRYVEWLELKLAKLYKKYRIITDMYCGFSVQCWRIWFPFWLQIDFTNTFLSLEEAKEALELHKNLTIHYEE